MRIPVPSRIEPRYAAIFIVAVLVAQVFEGTEPLFAFLCGVFFTIFVFFFNLCEGFLYPAGAWLGFYALGAAAIGVLWKIIIVEPGQTHLLQPDKTMLVYCVGMLAMGGGLSFAHSVRVKKPLLANFSVDLPGMWAAAIGCFVVGTALSFGLGGGGGAVGSILRQLNQFPRMALILATTYEVRRSGGKHSLNWVVLGSGGLILFSGILGFSKEGMFIPFVGWLLPAIAAGVVITRKMLLAGLVIVFVLVYWMVPYSQYGRQSRTEEETSLSEQIAAAEIYLFDLEGTRRAFNDLGSTQDVDQFNHFYDTPQGLADREQMLSPDDALINVTDQEGPFGLYPSAVMYLNAIPHFIWPDKPFLNSGNLYSHELGELADSDDTTGISFSPVADAYHEATWGGVLILLPIVLFLYGFINDSVVGSVTQTPWALLPIAMAVNIAPQGLLAGTAYLTTYSVVAVIFIAAVCRYVLAPLGGILAGSKGSTPQEPTSPPRPLGTLGGPRSVAPST